MPISNRKSRLSNFASARVSTGANITLADVSPPYQYIDPSANIDCVLPDPPTANQFFRIVHRGAGNDIRIKETAAGPIEVTLNTSTPVADCHYDGTEWQIITLGNI